MTWNKCEELRPARKPPVDLTKDDWKIAIAFGFAIVTASFVAGVFDGLDKAMEAQERHNRLSVYCQQYGALDKLCNSLKED